MTEEEFKKHMKANLIKNADGIRMEAEQNVDGKDEIKETIQTPQGPE